MAPRFRLEVFAEAQLRVNITTHSMVPAHAVLSAAEKRTLLERYKVWGGRWGGAGGSAVGACRLSAREPRKAHAGLAAKLLPAAPQRRARDARALTRARKASRPPPPPQIKDTQLPRISAHDPVARYYGVQRGQVVRVVRGSETAGRYVSGGEGLVPACV